MRLLSPRWLAGAWLLTAVVAAHALDIMPRSFSRTKQFVVYAKSGALRGAIGVLGDDTKAGILRALSYPGSPYAKDDWKIPIVVDLRVPEAAMQDEHPPVRLKLAQTGAGLKIELDLLIGEAGRGTRIRDELVRTILLDLAYRDRRFATAGQSYVPPPPWLVEGISAYVENMEDGVSASMFSALLPTTQAMPITEFLQRDPTAMDSTSRAVYRAYSYNLVSLLLQDVEGGRAGMAAFIRDLPTLPPEEARSAGILVQHFPQLAAEPDALEKWWTLGLARLAAADQYQAFSVEETEARLLPMLAFQSLPDPKKPTQPVKNYTLDDYEAFTGRKQARRLLDGTRRGLVELSGRANPLSRPIVLGYQEVVESLSQERTKGVRQRLAMLAAERQKVLKRQEGIADYVNWFEGTQMPDQSGAFENYFRAARQFANPRPVHRPDAISAYLDGLDSEFR